MQGSGWGMISQTTAIGYAHHARASEDITNTGLYML